MACKEYSEVLALAKGISATAIREGANGLQVVDLLPVISENMKNTIPALEGANKIGQEWADDLEGCILATVDFVVDVACDVLKVQTGTPVEYKETKELLAAVEGIVEGVVKNIPGFTAVDALNIVTDNFKAIIVGFEGADKIAAEFNGDIRSFLKFVTTSAIQLAFKIKSALEQKAE